MGPLGRDPRYGKGWPLPCVRWIPSLKHLQSLLVFADWGLIMQENVTKPDGMLWHASSEQDVISELQTSLSGLNDSEAAERLQRFGANTLLRKGSDSPWLIFWRQINNPIGWLLIASGALAVGLAKNHRCRGGFRCGGCQCYYWFYPGIPGRKSHRGTCRHDAGICNRASGRAVNCGAR